MAFPDPVSATLNGTSHVLNRIQTGGTNGMFKDGSLQLEVVPTTNRSGRTVVASRLTEKKVTTDPLVSTTNVEAEQTLTIAFNRPASGYSITESKALFTALVALLNADSGALLTKLLNQES